jgi:hypothetical protein
MVALGFECMLSLLKRWVKFPQSVLPAMVIPLFLCYNLYCQGFPIQREEIKAGLKYFEKNQIAGDQLYVYSDAQRAYTFYRDIHFFKEPKKVFYGSRIRYENSRLLSDLKDHHGRHWLLFSHIPQVEVSKLLSVLDTSFAQKLDSFKTKGASVTLINIK